MISELVAQGDVDFYSAFAVKFPTRVFCRFLGVPDEDWPIIDNPPEDSRVVVEEAFGPVPPLLKFNDIDDVIDRANRTEYGLAASV